MQRQQENEEWRQLVAQAVEGKHCDREAGQQPTATLQIKGEVERSSDEQMPDDENQSARAAKVCASPNSHAPLDMSSPQLAAAPFFRLVRR